jgi:predicted glutamine amidotransferase
MLTRRATQPPADDAPGLERTPFPQTHSSGPLAMCRLFGMNAGAEPMQASFWLLDAPDSLARQSHANPDGTGLGVFEHGRPVVYKQPISAYADAAFAREARTRSSRTFVAHVRFASTGALSMTNTHPFEQDGRLFAHNGVLGGLERLQEHLGEDLALVGGDTDSERLFALITREIAARNGDVRGGILAACEWVAHELPLYALNFVLITAEELFALRYPDTHELHVLERNPGGPRGQAPLLHHSSLGTRVHSAQAADRQIVVVASEPMDDDPGWRALDAGELIRVSPTLCVHSEILLSSAPAHPLTLADLDEHARASQQPAG